MKNYLINKEKFLETFKDKKLAEFSFLKNKRFFDVRPSETLAGIIANLTGDGHISRGLVMFTSKNRQEVENFKKEMEKVFKTNGKIRLSPTHKNTWDCVIGGNTIAKILNFCGAPFGNKTNNIFSVPEWITNGESKIQRKYIQKLFDCEGSVSLQRGKRILIKFSMYKNLKLKDNIIDFLNTIILILNSYGIKTTRAFSHRKRRRNDGSISIGSEFEIQGTKNNMDSILKFQKYINFENKVKRERLKEYINQLNNALLSPAK